MAEYYYSDSSRRGGKKGRKPLLLSLLDIVMILVAIPLFVAVALMLLSPYLHPSITWVFPIVGLFAPVLYAATLVITLYWIIRWKWLFALPMLGLVLIGFAKVSLYAKINTTNNIGDGINLRGSVRLLSYNVKLFAQGESITTWDIEPYAMFIDSVKADIVCFQEFDLKRYKSAPIPSMSSYNMHISRGMAIFTHYPIVDSSPNFAPEKSVGGGSIWADILIGKDTLRVFNNHLCSTTISGGDSDFISSPMSIFDSQRDEKLKDIFKRMHTQSIGRAEQVEVVAEVIAHSSGAVIVCGDLNDTPMSYTYHTISQGLTDAFREVGTGYANTFSGFLNMLRIDYIFGSKQIDFLLFERVKSMRESDHYPIITNFKIEEK